MVDSALKIMSSHNSTFQSNAQNVLLGKRTNCLLVKDDVGRSKPSTRDLPNNAFAFGKQTVFTEGAGDGKSALLSLLVLSCLLFGFIF